jgi:signal transduction histidine kinase
VVLVSDDDRLEGVVREMLATLLPVAVVGRATAADAGASGADAIIVDETIRGAPGIGAMQEIRARGFRGALVWLSSSRDEDRNRRVAALAPASVIVRAEMTATLAQALTDLASPVDPGDELSPVQCELRRIQQVVAAGEATLRVQHALNNPLTALLAEAQLLELEPLSDENRAAVKRIIELCRRMVGMVRSLDTVGSPARR